VNELKATIQSKHNEVIGYNEQLKENAIKQAQEDINRLTNTVFSITNKIESLLGLQSSSQNRLEELQAQMQETASSVEGTRQEWMQLVNSLNELREKLKGVEEEYKGAEEEYNNALASFNEFNLQVTRQHSKINALTQEFEFKSNQLNDLRNQVDANAVQLKQTVESISESEAALENAESNLVELMRRKEEEELKLNEADQAYYNQRNALQEKKVSCVIRQKKRAGRTSAGRD